MKRHGILPVWAALSLVLVLFLFPTATGGDVNGVEPSAETGPVEIPFELDRNRIVLPVRAEGSESLRIVLDTGMPIDGIYVFQKDFADQLNQEKAQEARVGGAGAGEASTAMLFDSTSVFVGDVEFPNRMVVVSMSATTQNFPRGGVIGKTLFADHAVEVDYGRSVIRLHPTTHKPDSTWTRVDLSIRKSIPFLKAELSVDDANDCSLDVYIDLASEEALELLVKPDMKFPLPPGLPEERVIGTGLSGDVHGREGRVAGFRIGAYELSDVAAEFVDAEVRSKQEGADGIIGNELLRRFNVIFNMTAAALYLKPNRHFDDPFAEPVSDH